MLKGTIIVRNRVKNGNLEVWERCCTVRLNAAERESLRDLSAARDAASKRRFRAWIEFVIGSRSLARDPETADLLLELLEKQAANRPLERCCWAFGRISNLIASWHTKVWPVANRLAHSPNPRVAELVPSFLLEHLLQYQFELYYPQVQEAIKAGDQRMAEMLDGCYVFGQAEAHTEEIAALLRSVGIEPNFGFEKSAKGT